MAGETVVPGDPFGFIRKDKQDGSPPAKDVNDFHTNSDKDSSQSSQHHSIGNQRNNASGGDHDHRGQNGRKLNNGGVPYTLTGAKGGNVALTNLIALLQNFVDITDTTS